MTRIVNFGIDTRNGRGYMLLGFVERNNSKIMNTFVYRNASKSQTWKLPNSET